MHVGTMHTRTLCARTYLLTLTLTHTHTHTQTNTHTHTYTHLHKAHTSSNLCLSDFRLQSFIVRSVDPLTTNDVFCLQKKQIQTLTQYTCTHIYNSHTVKEHMYLLRTIKPVYMYCMYSKYIFSTYLYMVHVFTVCVCTYVCMYVP